MQITNTVIGEISELLAASVAASGRRFRFIGWMHDGRAVHEVR